MTRKVQKLIRKIWFLVSGMFWYKLSLIRYLRLRGKLGVQSKLRYWPILGDRDPESHTFDKHYIYMNRWAAKLIFAVKPIKHVDVGSQIAFLSMVSIEVPTEFVDIRPVSLGFDNFTTKEGSILHLPYQDNSLQSVSCLHVAEHIGLGRYGDPLDPLGTVKACKELVRVLSPNGKLYFALPVGKSREYFNAHRIHSPSIILDYFKELTLQSFSVVNDAGEYITGADPQTFEGADYACGMFEFTKPA